MLGGMSLSTVSVILIEPVAVFEFGVAVEVFGLDRTDDGVPPFDFRVCSINPGRPLATKNISPFTITATARPGRRRRQRPGDRRGHRGPRAGEYPPEVLATCCRTRTRPVPPAQSVLRGRSCSAPPGCSTAAPAPPTGSMSTTCGRCSRRPSIDPRALFVDDGSVVTSAGTAAGIDACLHLVRRELGTAVANQIARRMVVPPQRDGGQQQFVDMPIPECTADSLAPLLTWVLDQPRRSAHARPAWPSGR